MESGPFSHKKFPKWSQSVVLYCNITSRVPGAKDQKLLEAAGGRGFPHFAVLDRQGRLLKPHPFREDRGMSGWSRTVEAAEKLDKKIRGLEEKAAKGDDKAVRELFLTQVEAGHLKFKEAQQTADTLQFSKSESTRLAQLMADLEFAEIRNLESPFAVSKCSKMFAADRIPSMSDKQIYFWINVLEGAAKAKDEATMKAALKQFKKSWGRDPMGKEKLKKFETQLKKL